MKRRKSKKRKIRPHILIIVEGETERNYFQAIKADADYGKALSSVKITINKKGQASKNIAQEIMQMIKRAERDDNPYDKVWWVFDHDNNPNRKEGYDQAKKANIRIAFSAFAFEQWYLLHFVKSAKAFSDINNLIKALQKHFPDYQKARQNDFELLKNKLNIAYKNTAWLRNNLEDKTLHITQQNPYTDVDILVQNLIDIGES